MKKVLLGTTALVSAGLVAQQAQAADPIELSIGGYHNWAYFFTKNDNNAATGSMPAQPGFNKADHDLKFDGELQIKGKTVLDNGLEVGVRIEIEGETQADQMDENYAYIGGSFGQFRFGNDDAVAATMATAAPYLNYLFAANSATVFTNGLSQFFSGALATTQLNTRTNAGAGFATFTTFPSMTGDDGQLIYFTPVFNGFQFGVSYTDGNGESRASLDYFLPSKVGASSVSPRVSHGEVYSVAGRYDGEVGDLGLTVAAGYVTAQDLAHNNATLPSDNMNAYDLGLVLYWGSWGLGGSYMNVQNMRTVAGTDTNSYDLGLAYYSDGPWSAGIYWLHQEIDYAAGTLTVTTNTDKFDAYRLQTAYDLGPGISVTGALGMDKFKDGVVNQTYDTTFVGAGILISF